MKQSDFLNFDELQKFVVNRKCKDVKFMDARKLIFDHEYREGYVIQTEYQANSIDTLDYKKEENLSVPVFSI